MDGARGMKQATRPGGGAPHLPQSRRMSDSPLAAAAVSPPALKANEPMPLCGVEAGCKVLARSQRTGPAERLASTFTRMTIR